VTASQRRLQPPARHRTSSPRPRRALCSAKPRAGCRAHSLRPWPLLARARTATAACSLARGPPPLAQSRSSPRPCAGRCPCSPRPRAGCCASSPRPRRLLARVRAAVVVVATTPPPLTEARSSLRPLLLAQATVRRGCATVRLPRWPRARAAPSRVGCTRGRCRSSPFLCFFYGWVEHACTKYSPSG